MLRKCGTQISTEELRSHLLKKLPLYKEIANRFKKKNEMSLTQLEEEIEKEGAPTEKHEIWEDSIEWRNSKP